MPSIKITKGSAESLVKRMFFLAWKACRSAVGMGWLQDRGELNEDQVWNICYNSLDYPGRNALRGNRPGDVYGDYVSGRMMKVGFKWTEDIVACPGGDSWRRDCQAFCGRYPKFFDLAVAAAIEIDVEFEIVP